MIKKGEKSWIITKNEPEILNFALYLGCVYGIIPKPYIEHTAVTWPKQTLESDCPLPILKKEWENWWTFLVQERQKEFHSKVRIKQELFMPEYHITSQFLNISRCCEHTLEPFRTWWHAPNGCYQKFIQYQHLSSQCFRGCITKLQEEQNRKLHPFTLHMDFVFAGLSDINRIDTSYIIVVPTDNILVEERWLEIFRNADQSVSPPPSST